MNTKDEIWIRIKDLLALQLTTTAVDTWFDDAELLSLADDKAVIYSPSDFKRDVIRKRYSENILSVLHDLFAADFELTILGQNDRLDQIKNDEPRNDTLHDEFTFENYIVGNSNRIAHAAASSVAENPASAYNPLFIYGESGLGKTHLLCAISNAVKKRFPKFRIVYMKGDEFTNELVAAIRSGKNTEFREKYRSADLFLMDDIQFIAGKDSTQEEFFHTFNSLYEAKKQIVLTSDRPPNDMARLENRLRTRFEGGLIVEITPPDFEMRSAIIRKKSEQLGLYLNDKQVNYISENITNNVRQLEGTVKKILAYLQLGDKDLSGDAVTRAVDEMRKDKGKEMPPPALIISEVCRYYSVSENEIKGQRKVAELAMARQIAMYLLRKMTNLSFSDIGKLFQDRDHTTVMHGVTKIEKKMSDATFKNTLEEIIENINARI
ncbi:MAG: chromosomal replication initiator protein DnaA [Clostridiales bacterium]|jgi:chromosomal replication initiator protein|nr:chromosomal replication initiator protein DnaA [Clostridiales bacterium]